MNVTNKESQVSTECEEYSNCDGSTFCICREVEEVVTLPHLIPPLPFNFTAGHEVYVNAIVGVSMYLKGESGVLHTRRPLKVGDIIHAQGSTTLYYLNSKERRRDKYNHFIFTVKRVDRTPLNNRDLNRFKKGKTIIVQGYLK